MTNKKSGFKDFPVPDVVFIDVDGTLIVDGNVNHDLVMWARQQATNGKDIIVWSARGKSNAEHAVDICGIRDIVSHMISKPGYVVDDLGNGWTQYMNIIHVDDINRSKQNKTSEVYVSLL